MFDFRKQVIFSNLNYNETEGRRMNEWLPTPPEPPRTSTSLEDDDEGVFWLLSMRGFCESVETAFA